MKKYVIKLNGKAYEVEIEEVTGEAATSVVEKEAPVRTSAPVQNAGGQKIDAPMPGNIVNVAVKPGDVIKKGQLLVVLEAMKMENEIVSPVDGTVTAVSVAKGDSVNAGDALVQIA
ncbi:biotin/lipoyl-containing protein [Clostridium omnivorum]|uniref:Acetyl-CoA carboxylase biotin carboxyl carrier protein subunit n=1 Tax=Clostridium omnivorum TaxID=1604902 RepID=A0ABQ5N3U4_9CLOT|nr:biotin/lipoyl-containing protein [Clostridium sp. E14]GLC29878.1 acetyl-CoA carboxylase biotin carboxyl carrier protein subunit [Clostridium sp. E14]